MPQAATQSRMESTVPTSQAPLISGGVQCRTCEITVDDAQAYRVHLKSDSHVHKLRLKHAEPGTTVVAFGDEGRADTYFDTSSQSSSSPTSASSSDTEESEEGQAPVFDPAECLFCGQHHKNTEGAFTHMYKAHGFKIPNQNSLNVDVETLLWYLHLVIYVYSECTSCGKRKHSLEAVQQHMLTKGHCKFEMAGEYLDFYDLASLEIQKVDDLVHPDDASLRLASGRVLTHRSQSHQAVRSSAQRSQSDQQREQLPGNPTKASTSAYRSGPPSRSVERRERKVDSLAVQLSQLTAGDRMALMHLSVPEQRSMLARRKKAIEQSQRAERRAALHVQRKGNRTLRAHFRPDVPFSFMG